MSKDTVTRLPALGHLLIFVFPPALTMSAGGREPPFFSFFFLQGASIGLVRTNHALLSLVDTNLA